jgi:hypothetical protein
LGLPDIEFERLSAEAGWGRLELKLIPPRVYKYQRISFSFSHIVKCPNLLLEGVAQKIYPFLATFSRVHASQASRATKVNCGENKIFNIV